MTSLPRLFDRLLDWCGALCAILLLLCAILINLDALTRDLQVASLAWVIEVVEYAMLGVTFLAAPWLLKQDEHVRVELLVESLPRSARDAFKFTSNLLGMAICGVILWYGMKVTIEVYQADIRVFKILIVKEWWLLSVIPFSAALMLIEFGRRVSHRAKRSTSLKKLEL